MGTADRSLPSSHPPGHLRRLWISGVCLGILCLPLLINLCGYSFSLNWVNFSGHRPGGDDTTSLWFQGGSFEISYAESVSFIHEEPGYHRFSVTQRVWNYYPLRVYLALDATSFWPTIEKTRFEHGFGRGGDWFVLQFPYPLLVLFIGWPLLVWGFGGLILRRWKKQPLPALDLPA